MARISKVLDSLTNRIETAEVLDHPAAALSAVLQPLFPGGAVKDALSGTPLGHPAHPALVAVPIGSWVAAGALDVFGDGGDRTAARRLVGFGLIAAVPTMATGASDWMETNQAEQRVGFLHAVLNYAVVGAYAGSWLARRTGRHRLGVALAGAGAGVLTVSGWLGAHLSYAMGVGVDTTAFEAFPTHWTDALPVDDLGSEPAAATAGGVPVVLVRDGKAVRALADRCTHRGGALSDGEQDDDCLVCPLHGSRFSIVDGSVERGPATRPQPVLETRVRAGKIQVRRHEVRALRTSPVGP